MDEFAFDERGDGVADLRGGFRARVDDEGAGTHDEARIARLAYPSDAATPAAECRLCRGNVTGLSASDKKALERIWRRRVDPHVVVTPELAAYLCEVSHQVKRQVGVMLDRRGDILHVIIGDQDKIMLPDLGPRRAGQGRFRGIRLVHTHLRGEPLTRDDFMDLAKLHLDAIAAIRMTPRGQLGPVDIAHLLPANPKGEQWRALEPIPRARDTQRAPARLPRAHRVARGGVRVQGCADARGRRRQGARGARAGADR